MNDSFLFHVDPKIARFGPRFIGFLVRKKYVPPIVVEHGADRIVQVAGLVGLAGFTNGRLPVVGMAALRGRARFFRRG
jgi:hypothetical protein